MDTGSSGNDDFDDVDRHNDNQDDFNDSLCFAATKRWTSNCVRWNG